MWISNQTKQRILKRGLKKKKWHIFTGRILYCLTFSGIGTPALRNCLECSLPAKQGSNYLCLHCVTLQEATIQNNQQKEASGDTDGSANCLRKEKKKT